MKKIILFGVLSMFFCAITGGLLFAQKNKELSDGKRTVIQKSLTIKSYDTQTTTPLPNSNDTRLQILREEPTQKTPRGVTIKVPILMYHHVREFTEKMTPIARGLTVTPESLEKQLSYFQREGYTSFTLDQLSQYISSEQKPPQKSIIFTFDDGYRDFYQNAYPLFKKYNLHATIFLIADDIEAPAYLTWEQIHDMATSGLIEFGSHTLTHPELSKESVDEQKKQITESKDLLEKKLNKKITFFCYPYGKYTKVTVSLVKDTGYEGALTTHFGISYGPSNMYEMPRVRIGNGDIDAHLTKKMHALLKL